jgi:hypothetical protein
MRDLARDFMTVCAVIMSGLQVYEGRNNLGHFPLGGPWTVAFLLIFAGLLNVVPLLLRKRSAPIESESLRGNAPSQSIVQKNVEVSPKFNVGSQNDHAYESEKVNLRRENLIYEHMRRTRSSKKNHLIGDVAAALHLTQQEASESLTRLFAKDLIGGDTLDTDGGFVYWLKD